jgi:nitrate/TMAO reductase-like tetraheme cytochrome c subunit
MDMKVRHYFFYWIGIIGLAMLVFVAAFVGTSETEFCRSCHIMKEPYATWQRGTHNKVACESCHMAEDMSTKVMLKAMSLGRVYATLFGDPKLTKNLKLVSDEKCQTCHSQGYYFLVVNGIAINHRVHTKFRDVTCGECHPQSAHKDKGYSIKERMEFCVECHKVNSGPVECDVCHRRDESL